MTRDELFRRCAFNIATDTQIGHDWGSYILVNTHSGSARRSWRKGNDEELTWAKPTRPTTEAWLLRKWEAYKRQEAKRA